MTRLIRPPFPRCQRAHTLSPSGCVRAPRRVLYPPPRCRLGLLTWSIEQLSERTSPHATMCVFELKLYNAPAGDGRYRVAKRSQTRVRRRFTSAGEGTGDAERGRPTPKLTDKTHIRCRILATFHRTMSLLTLASFSQASDSVPLRQGSGVLEIRWTTGSFTLRFVGGSVGNLLGPERCQRLEASIPPYLIAGGHSQLRIRGVNG